MPSLGDRKYLAQTGLPILQVIWVRYAGHVMVMLILLMPQQGLSGFRSNRPMAQMGGGTGGAGGVVSPPFQFTSRSTGITVPIEAPVEEVTHSAHLIRVQPRVDQAQQQLLR